MSALPLTPKDTQINHLSLSFLICKIGLIIWLFSKGVDGDCREFLVWKYLSPTSSPVVVALGGSSYQVGRDRCGCYSSRGSCLRRNWFLTVRLSSSDSPLNHRDAGQLVGVLGPGPLPRLPFPLLVRSKPALMGTVSMTGTALQFICFYGNQAS